MPNRTNRLFSTGGERVAGEWDHTQRRALNPAPKLRRHDLRHTWATLPLNAGVHPKIVSERLSPSTIAITLDLYSHVLPGMQSEAAEQVSSMIFGNA